MKKILFLLGAVSSMTLVSCGQYRPSDNYQIKFISPTGAPVISLYEEALKGNLETNTVPSNVGAQLQGHTYGGVIFDFYNGLKSIKANSADYKLARIITGGNFYLVGIDKTEAPTKDDYIVSFGENLLPDLVYSQIYGEEIAEVTHYVNGVADCGAILESGLHNGNEVDYVLVAQPILFAKTNSSPIKERLTVVASLRDEWEDLTGQTAIPQAGLFINQTQYNAHKDKYTAFFDEFEDSISTCIEDPQTMKNAMDEYGTLEQQASLFGFNSNVAFNVQKNGQNGFALVDYEDEQALDIEEFLTTLGVADTNFADYIM